MAHPNRPVTRTYWRRGVVIAVRGDRVIIQSRGFLYTHPWWELRDPPRYRPSRLF
jgi:hypothetical protein